MKLNKRLRKGTDEGPRTLTKEDILDVVKTLIGVRDGHDDLDDIDNLGNRRIRLWVRWLKTSSSRAYQS